MYFYTIFLLLAGAYSLHTRCADNAHPVVHVSAMKHKLILPFDRATYIAAFKQSVCIYTGIPIERQHLYLVHRPDELSKNSKRVFLKLDDSRTCEDYGLCNNTKLELFLD